MKPVRPRATAKGIKAHDARARGAEEALTNLEIARRAYEIYQSRGATPGRALDDWLAAEQDLRGVARQEDPGR